MYSKEVFSKKVKEWLLKDGLLPKGIWEIHESSDDSVFIIVSLTVKLNEVKEIQGNVSTKDDEESIRIAVKSLYNDLLKKENRLLDEMAKSELEKLGV